MLIWTHLLRITVSIAIIQFYFTLWWCCICISTCITIVKCLKSWGKCTLWYRAPIIFASRLLVPSTFVKVYDDDIHWCIHMTLYKLRISDIAYRIKWLALLELLSKHVSWHLFQFNNEDCLWYPYSTNWLGFKTNNVMSFTPYELN